mgnify:CR=1 FL=1
MKNHCRPAWLAKTLLMLGVLVIVSGGAMLVSAAPPPAALKEIEQEVNAYVPDARYADDLFILATLKEAVAGSKQLNGGIGACLVAERSGEILEQGHNSQYVPYFKSDLHAEMDLLNRYEERVRMTRISKPGGTGFYNPREQYAGLVLYTSVEPCPMCLTRIINAGIRKVYYAAPDDNGGMAHKLQDLPPFWQNMAQGMTIEPARCSPVLKELARRLFHPMGALH